MEDRRPYLLYFYLYYVADTSHNHTLADKIDKAENAVTYPREFEEVDRDGLQLYEVRAWSTTKHHQIENQSK